jgi:hypothetical protein
VAVGARERLHVRPAAEAGPGDHIRFAVVVHVAGRHLDAAGEGGVVGEEAQQGGTVAAADDLDVRAAGRPGAGDEVGEAVAVDVAGRDEGAAGEQGGGAALVERFESRPGGRHRRALLGDRGEPEIGGTIAGGRAGGKGR